MMNSISALFKRGQRAAPLALPGPDMVARRVDSGALVPKRCVGVIFDQGGRTRRVAEGGKLVLADRESACCFHPGPYACDLVPFTAAPELGLRLSFGLDCADPRVTQQRFDLYLMSEAGESLSLAEFAAAIEGALRHELDQGNLALPPCTTLDEWNAFRAGFNQLLYTRFGVTVADCVPVDLGEHIDYASLLRARAQHDAAPSLPAPSQPAPEPVFDHAAGDALALRRLFLELPCLMCALRVAVLPQGQALFQQHKALLQRLDQVSLAVNTMPALELAAPGVLLGEEEQTRRARHSLRAAVALDEAWALLARVALASSHEPLFAEAERIVANLEFDCASRRQQVVQRQTP